MFCQQCGTKNKDGSKFCMGCGANLTQQVAAPQAAAPSPQPPVQQAAPQQQMPPQQPAPQYTPPQRPVRDYTQDPQTIGQCFGKSWFEMRRTPSWVGKVFLFALILMVPILNFVALGYFWNLARHAARKENTPYPQIIFDADNFKNGFFVFIVIAIFSAICTACLYPSTLWVNNYNGILKALSVFLVIVFIGVCIFLPAVSGLMKLRIVLIDFAAGFRLGEVFRVYGRQFGKNLLVFTVGMGVVVLASYILWCVCVAINISIYISMIYTDAYAYASMLKVDMWMMMWIMMQGTNSVLGAILLLIATYIPCVVLAAGLQIVVRAQGYYVLRFIPEWLVEQPAPRPQPAPQPQAAPAPQPQAAPAAAPAQAPSSVKFTAGPGNEFVFSQFPSTIGTAPNASLSIGGDTMLDPVHCIVDVNERGQICIFDNGSKNGTKLNNKKISANKKFAIKNGDTVNVGSVTFTVQLV